MCVCACAFVCVCVCAQINKGFALKEWLSVSEWCLSPISTNHWPFWFRIEKKEDVRGRNRLQFVQWIGLNIWKWQFTIVLVIHDLLCKIGVLLFSTGAFRLMSQSALCSGHLCDSSLTVVCSLCPFRREKANERRKWCVCVCLSDHTWLFVCIHVPACDIQRYCVDSNGPWEVSASPVEIWDENLFVPAGIWDILQRESVSLMCKRGRVSSALEYTVEAVIVLLIFMKAWLHFWKEGRAIFSFFL